MPTLFISYKRGTAAVAPLMEKLRDAHYRLWFDRDEIHLGDPDWQAQIDTGLTRCDAVILNITPEACKSKPVQYEVKKAQELGKPIFPIILEKIKDYDKAIKDLGLAPKQHIEDFTDVTKWDEQIQRLLRDLVKQDLRVSHHEIRQERDPDNPKYRLHQMYLKKLADQIGTLNLAQINPEQGQDVYLEEVYVDSPTGLNISVEVENWQVIDWWISRDDEHQQRFGNDNTNLPRIRPEEFGNERSQFEALIGNIDEQIAKYREENPDLKPDEEKRYRNSWNNGIHNNVIHLHLNHLVATSDRLVILGLPGSGKSTFVKYLALCLAGSEIDGWARQSSAVMLENWSHGALTPIYVELRRFVASKYFPSDVKTPVTSDHLWSYIQNDLLDKELKEYAEDLRYDLEHGHTVLILDGLDEVPFPEGKLKDRQRQLIGLAHSINTRFPTSRVIFASRPYAYQGWTLPGFNAVTITSFADQHRIELAKRLYLAARIDETTAAEKSRALNSQLANIDSELKDRPLFVTLMATIYLKSTSEGLPTRRGALYRASIMLLLDRWTTSKPGAPSLVEILGDQSLDDLYNRLASLAYDVHSNYGEQKGTPEIDVGEIYKHLMPLGGIRAAQLIPYLSENAGVLVSPGQDDQKDVFHFAHRTFQEYLAGAHLVSLCTEADSFDLMADRIMSKPNVWRMPCTLAGDVLADTERRGDLWDLLDDLMDEEISHEIAPNDMYWWKVWLASEILQQQHMLNGEKLRRSEKAVCDQLGRWTLKAIKLGALQPPERASCGRALGLLGDPRPGVGLRPDGLPDLVWCEVPAPANGNFMIGNESYEPNQHPAVKLSYNFKMTKYLVTYQQFQSFINSGEYEDERWWDGMPEGIQYQHMDPQNNRYNNHPRENVSWYQAIAFTRWLTMKYMAIGIIESNVEIRLPTKYEWEYAAKGSGESNTIETNINQSSAVGIFPNGKSTFGVYDMAGLLWEWCLNDIGDLLVINGYRNNIAKVVRGGSYATVGNIFVDGQFDPIFTHHEYGFRVVYIQNT